MVNIFIIICLSLAFFSAISSSLVIWAHLKIPQLRRHPAQMIIIIGIIQIMYDVQWSIILPFVQEKVVKSGACYYFAIVFMSLSYFSANLCTSLLFEMILKIQYPLRMNYSLRTRLYIVITFLLSLAEITPIFILGTFGLSSNEGICTIERDSPSAWFIGIPVFINIPLDLIALSILMKTKKFQQNKALKRLVIVSFAMIICLGFPVSSAIWQLIFHQSNALLNGLCLLVGCCSGIVLALCRFSSVKILKKLFCSRSRNRNSVIDAFKSTCNYDEISLQAFFLDFTKDKYQEILISICLIMSKVSRTTQYYSYHYEKHKHYFQKEDYKELGHSLKYKSADEVVEYGRSYFNDIKKHSGVENEDILNSFISLENFSVVNQNSAGKSGAFILITKDERFVLKIINREERLLLLDILPSYTERIKDPFSKIVKILGLFKIKSSECSFIIMENVVANKKESTVFDLKGSKYNRRVVLKDVAKNVVLKDLNLLEMGYKFSLSAEARTSFLKALEEDIKFFTRFNIMDYSLLVAFYSEDSFESRYKVIGDNEKVYALGFIDFLQTYSFSKRLELVVKTILCRFNVSSCSPFKYSLRLLEFVKKNLLDK